MMTEKMINGIPYEKFDSQEFWSPVGYPEPPPPIVCECGCEFFKVTYPEPYFTNATCVRCDRVHEVHSG